MIIIYVGFFFLNLFSQFFQWDVDFYQELLLENKINAYRLNMNRHQKITSASDVPSPATLLGTH